MTEEEKNKKRRAYSKYVQDPVFIALVILSILLVMTSVYFALGSQCPAGTSSTLSTSCPAIIDDVTAEDTTDVETDTTPTTPTEDPIAKALTGDLPAATPEKGSSIGSFKSLLLEDGICTEDGKPIIRLFSTTWCPHCKWVKDTFESTIQEYVDAGKIVAYHWELDTDDDSLTEEVESSIPDSEYAIYQQFNPKATIPTFVFGCKYYRVGNAYEQQNDLDAEEADFKQVIDALIRELAT